MRRRSNSSTLIRIAFSCAKSEIWSTFSLRVLGARMRSADSCSGMSHSTATPECLPEPSAEDFGEREW
jgi:hypothetical protein